jgi:hypothetical protein
MHFACRHLIHCRNCLALSVVVNKSAIIFCIFFPGLVDGLEFATQPRLYTVMR